MEQLCALDVPQNVHLSKGRLGRNPEGANGVASEHEVIARLLRSGHKVAVPVVDDDGVDLIVNYRTTVQVKMSGLFQVTQGPNPERYHYNIFKSPSKTWNADVFAFHGVGAEADTWWVIPAAVIRASGHKSAYNLRPPSAFDASPRFHEWIDAWHVFDEH